METFELKFHKNNLQKVKISLTQSSCKIFFYPSIKACPWNSFFFLADFLSLLSRKYWRLYACQKVSFLSKFHDFFMFTIFLLPFMRIIFLQFLFPLILMRFGFTCSKSFNSMKTKDWVEKMFENCRGKFLIRNSFLLLVRRKTKSERAFHVCGNSHLGKLEKTLLTTGESEFSRETLSIFASFCHWLMP